MLAANDVAATLATWQPGHGRVLERALPLLADMLQTDFFGCYLPTRSLVGWELDFGYGHLRNGLTQKYEREVRRCLEQVVSSAPSPMRLATVPREEQNKVYSFRETATVEEWESHGITQLVVPALGFNKDCYDLRVLCADRGRLLGWCGTYQSRPFTSSQKALFQMVVPTLRSQSMLERKLGLSELHEQAFISALEAIPQSAYLVDGAARIVAANTRAQRQLEGRNRSKEGRLCEWVRSARNSSVPGAILELPEATVSSITARGLPIHYLVVERPSNAVLEQRVLVSTRKWALTPRQSEILRWVAEGESNKDIACRFACSQRSVEHHVSGILAKSGFQSRAALAANLPNE